MFFNFFKKNKIDWYIFFSAFFLSILGLSVMPSFESAGVSFFEKQAFFIFLGIVLFFLLASLDFYFLKKSSFIIFLYLFSVFILILLFFFGTEINGARSWFDFIFFKFQPTDFVKISLIIILAKFFSRRHIEISRFLHFFVSGIYAFIPFLLIFLQPDFGSAFTLFLIWFFMIFFSGLSKKYILFIFSSGILIFLSFWFFVFAPYQKERLITFLSPESDFLGAGYNISQAQIAIGSGGFFGKGYLGGTQSRLSYLPENESDFIFSAFSEEWGFFGIILLFLFFGTIIYRLGKISLNSRDNFSAFLTLGVATYFLSHFFVHIGVNLGFLPVTGTTLPFLSYGGSHILSEFIALGIIVGLSKNNLLYKRKYSEKELFSEK